MLQSVSHSFKRNWLALSVGGRAALRAFKAARSPQVQAGSFEPLTPTLLEDDRFKRYEQELLKALHNDEVLNIAITGAYGAGKSSVVKTFFERHPEFSYALVSLATFSKAKPASLRDFAASHENESLTGSAFSTRMDETAPATPDLINRIEETIVQQLLYAVPAAKLPKTRLKRIVQASRLSVLIQTLLCSLLLVSILTFCLPSLETQTDLNIGWFVRGLSLFPEWLAIAITLLGGFYLLYSGFRFVSMFSIDGLTLKEGRLEATHHGSVLHKNLDEIIHCFERSDINVVVIEDLDRFDIQDVFFRLREINFIIRRSPQINRSVHFIYAIRDELFTVTDKTKFFDLIIPIIPVVNSENSHEKLTELMKSRTFGNVELGAKLEPSVVETVCYHINEMRLIKNIVNEYDIYSSLLARDGLKLDPNKLFAIVVFRNLHPDAYAELIKREGAVYNLFDNFPKWIKQETEVLHARVLELQAKQRLIEGEVASDLEHLRACVWFEIIKQGKLTNANTVKNEERTMWALTEFIEDASFEIFKSSKKVQPMFITPHSSWNGSGDFVEPEYVLRHIDYQARVDRLSASVDEISNEVDDLFKQIKRLRTLPFREAAKGVYSSSITEGAEGLDVVIYFMRRGLLDTDYADYLGYFYEGSLTQADKNFILALSRGETLDVATSLQNFEKVVSKLDFDSFTAGRGIVVGLIGALARHQNDNSIEHAAEKLSLVLKSGYQHLDRLSEAIELLIFTPDCYHVIQAIYSIDKSLIHHLLQAERFKHKSAQRAIISAILECLTLEQVEAMRDRTEWLIKAVNGISDVAELMGQLETSVGGWKWVREKPAQFNNLSDTTTPADLRKLVQWECISLTVPMLKLLLRRLADEWSDEHSVTYHRLQELNLPSLNSTINKNPEAFVSELLSQDHVLPESEGSLVHLLNSIEHDPLLMEKLLDSTDCLISALERVPRSLWGKIIDDDRVSELGRAAWDFFEQGGNDSLDKNAEAAGSTALHEAFIAFVERHADALACELWSCAQDRQVAMQSYLVRSDGVSNDTLRVLLAPVILDSSVIITSSLPAERWALFAYSDFVPYTLSIREAFIMFAGSLEGAYINKHWNTAKEDLDLSSLAISVVWEVSRNGGASMQETLAMWEGVPFDAFDTCQGSVVELASVCGRANAAGSKFSEGYLPILLQVLQSGDLSRDGRVWMIIQALALNCNWEQIAPALELIGGGYQMLSKSRRVQVPNSDEDLSMLESLRRRDFVGTIKVDKKHIVAYGRHSSMR